MLKASTQPMCKKIVTMPLPFSLMYLSRLPQSLLDLVVELTPLETFG